MARVLLILRSAILLQFVGHDPCAHIAVSTYIFMVPQILLPIQFARTIVKAVVSIPQIIVFVIQMGLVRAFTFVGFGEMDRLAIHDISHDSRSARSGALELITRERFSGTF